MRCQKCGRWLPLLYRFCTSCGTAIGTMRNMISRIQLVISLILSALGAWYLYTRVGDVIYLIDVRRYAILVAGGFFVILTLAFELLWSALWSKQRYEKIASLVILAILVCLCLYGQNYYFTHGPIKMPDNVASLSGAVFSNQPKADPVMLEYPMDGAGKLNSALVFPGEINIFVAPDTKPADVKALFAPYNGKVVNEIPKLGFYTFTVDNNLEIKALRELLQKPASLVTSVAPNFAVQGSMVDLSWTGKSNPNEITTALISTPDPSAKVIIAQLDNFVPLGNSKDVNLQNYGSFGSTDSHGYKVYEAMKPIIGNAAVMQVHVGGWPCERMPSALCSSADHTVNALAATIAGAEINGQKVDINLSYNVVPHTTDPAQFATVNDPKANSWATDQWKGYEKQLYDVMRASDWAQNGNVVLTQSAGNGANLVDANGQIINTKGMNISNAVNDLKRDYPDIHGNVNFCGAMDFETGKIKPYSNFGTGVTYVKIRPGSPEGTSFAAPIMTGVTYIGWDEHYEYGPDIINNAVRQYAVKTANFYKLDDLTKAWFYRYIENLEQNQINANVLEKKLDTLTKKAIEEKSKIDYEQKQSSKPIILTEPKIPEPPPVDLDKIDASGQTTDPCRWGGPGCK